MNIMIIPKLELINGMNISGVFIGKIIYMTKIINRNISKGEMDFKKSNFIIIYSGWIFL